MVEPDNNEPQAPNPSQEGQESKATIWEQVNKRLFSLRLHPLVIDREKALNEEIQRFWPTDLVFYRDEQSEEWETDNPAFRWNAAAIAAHWMRLYIADMEAEIEDLHIARDRTLEVMNKERTPELVRAFHDEVVLPCLHQKADGIRQKFDRLFATARGRLPDLDLGIEEQKVLLEDEVRRIHEACHVRTETEVEELGYKQQSEFQGKADSTAQVTPLESQASQTVFGSKVGEKHQPRGFEDLGEKTAHLSGYLHKAALTTRQLQCASLKWEYALTDRKIADRLGITHTTVQEHLEAAEGKLNRKVKRSRPTGEDSSEDLDEEGSPE